MELNDTIKMMDNADYKERFKAEYYQVKIRLERLQTMLEKWDYGGLDFTPACPRDIYDFQVEFMIKYMQTLVIRASIEKIDLTQV